MDTTVPSIVNAAETSITQEIRSIKELSDVASNYPYYKFNYAWSRQMQDAVRSSHILQYIWM